MKPVCQQTSPFMHLLDLPSEVLVEVLLYLEDTTLASVSVCSKQLLRLCSSEILWRRLSSPFGVTDRDQPALFSCKTLYQKLLAKYAWLLGLWQSDYTFHGALLLVDFDPKSAAIRGVLIQVQELLPEPVNVWSLDRGVVIIDPSFDIQGQDLFYISLNDLGNPTVRIFQPGTDISRSLHGQHHDSVDIVECMFEGHEHCQYLWSSVRDSMQSTDRDHDNNTLHSSTREQSTYAFTFRLPDIVPHEQGSTDRSKYSHIPLHSPTSRKLFYWMTNSNAWIDQPPRFCKLPSSITGLKHPIQLGHLNNALLKHPAVEVTNRNSGFPVGLFKCHYGSHGLEYLIIRYDESNHALVCNKVTGDFNIPRSEVSWIVPDTRYPLRVCMEEEFRSALAYDALGHVAYQGFTGNRMIPAELIIVNQDKLALHWRDLMQIIVYNRCTMEEFNQCLKSTA